MGHPATGAGIEPKISTDLRVGPPSQTAFGGASGLDGMIRLFFEGRR
jgi:hypothetical protein